MITIFTPSFADESNTNAQNLTVKEIVARLDPSRFHVTMLTDAPADPRIAERPNTRLVQWKKHGNTVRSLFQCLRNIPDVYFYPREGPLDAGFLRLRRWLGLRTSIVTHVVSGGLDREVRPTLVRNIREAQAVFGNCVFLSNLIRERLGADAGTIHNGIDRRFFFSPGRNERSGNRHPTTVLFAGSFRPNKRVDILIRQAARRPTVHFRIAGHGDEEQKCHNMAAELGCGNVAFLGHLSLRQLGEEMRRADLFLFPSILEGHPQVLGQAAACGLPAVAMNIYRPDYIVDGKTGFLAESDEDLEQKLDLLLTNQDTRRSMAEAAIVHARKFDWDEIVRQWETVFERAVVRRPRH